MEKVRGNGYRLPLAAADLLTVASLAASCAFISWIIIAH